MNEQERRESVSEAEEVMRMLQTRVNIQRMAGQTQTLARRWYPLPRITPGIFLPDTAGPVPPPLPEGGGRYRVVFKLDRWRAGMLLLSEAPLLFTGPPRQMTCISAALKKEDANDEAARWARCEAARRAGRSEGDILLDELSLQQPTIRPSAADAGGGLGLLLAELRNAYGWRRLWPNDAADASKAAARLEAQSMQIRGLFSRQPVVGRAFYPFLQHVRRTHNAAEANAVIWFEESIAQLHPFRDLSCGEEIIVFDDEVPEPNGQDGELPRWLRLAANRARLGAGAGGQRDEEVHALQKLIVDMTEHVGVGANCLLLAKLQFLLADILCDKPTEIVAHSGGMKDLAAKMRAKWGIDVRRGPFEQKDEKDEKNDKEMYAEQLAVDVGARRLSMLDLLGALCNDVGAVHWRTLWFEAPHHLARRASATIDRLVAVHGSLHD